VGGDPDCLTQVLMNLVSNARKYTPVEGRITIVTRADERGVHLTVRDTGIGLTPEEHDHLFSRFFRAKNATTRRVSGTGLGLAITRSLVELHDGTSAVESEPGRGSEFRVTLVAAQPGGSPH
jgi:two-component system phosphate regulon sensor histidine kinase PhoR